MRLQGDLCSLLYYNYNFTILRHLSSWSFYGETFGKANHSCGADTNGVGGALCTLLSFFILWFYLRLLSVERTQMLIAVAMALKNDF